MAAAEALRRPVRGPSGAAFRERLGTEAACREALFRMRWREGLTCPACGHRGSRELGTREVFRGSRCGRRLSLAAGAVVQDGGLPLVAWLAATRHSAPGRDGIGSVELGRRLGVGRATARLVRRELVRAMAARETGRPELEGRVEIGDAYLGGERPGGRRGRGAAGRTPLAAAVGTTPERRPGRPRPSVVKGFRKEGAEELARRDSAAGGTTVSDGPRCWKAVTEAGRSRAAVVTGAGERAARRTPLKGADTCLGNIKAAVAGTCHHVGARHARSHPASSACRLDRRRQLDTIVERLARAAIHAGPQPHRVIISDA
jgi:ISXO2-like transposase domain/Transposase zinc-ribbon domain